MSIGIGENLTGSFGFAKDKLGGNIGTWLILAILNIIPIVNWIVYGVYIKVLRGEDPELKEMGKSFIDGLFAIVISIIYMIIPIILSMVVFILTFSMGSMTVTPGMTHVPDMMGIFAVGMNIALMFLCLIVTILFSLLLIPAIVNFARNGFGAAFKFSMIFGMISKAGWVNYILSMILMWIIFTVIIFVCMIIPILGWILLIFIMPFLYVWGAKYFANLFE
ncbi:MAG TPA: DUF4013 domain-containing protein [Methanocorpusculum sp.]|nr:DUF4013 domain-containing protein [Methanocorpusculum sp.]